MRPPVYVLRHGETVWNRARRLQGALDSPLTARGQVQAARQGAILRRAEVTAPVLCSPQPRARRTAALAGLSPVLRDELREITMGDWDGREIDAIAPPGGMLWKFEGPGGESRQDAEVRVARLIDALDGPAVLVTHGVVSLLIRAHLLGLTLQDIDGLEDPQGVVHRVEKGRETLLR
ncbi:histidine phosphatase family protein [Jannaschia marina]|uniref:histidine phosphatase family protein n=1 Tax=Jannaschia marina TaxID=2741674 RepID=UPI0015CEE469|nr:histidine phosphatase family protein [Jannaschia marina]